MESRIQFRVDAETKRLAQLAAEKKGLTISDACRDLTIRLAEEQIRQSAHDQWLREEVDKTYARYDRGELSFVSHDEAKEMLARRRSKIRKLNPSEA